MCVVWCGGGGGVEGGGVILKGYHQESQTEELMGQNVSMSVCKFNFQSLCYCAYAHMLHHYTLRLDTVQPRQDKLH